MVQRREDIIEEVTEAIRNLASRRVGALIVLEREVGLNEYIEIGTRLDARVSRELIESVFLPGSPIQDRKSTRLNSSHLVISYAVFCLKKKITTTSHTLSS